MSLNAQLSIYHGHFILVNKHPHCAFSLLSSRTHGDTRIASKLKVRIKKEDPIIQQMVGRESRWKIRQSRAILAGGKQSKQAEFSHTTQEKSRDKGVRKVLTGGVNEGKGREQDDTLTEGHHHDTLTWNYLVLERNKLMQSRAQNVQSAGRLQSGQFNQFGLLTVS